ncbi:unnamed protein product [Cylicocyclus nassatus]|uniref:protein-tyrosine-phosphatase n=1 Tax=Cylicocyclus nassatus TaxID=53992 RepID=A0AA36DT77_CYLNA|nr:unnamed protein product [Cylicocyclus nassatus]
MSLQAMDIVLICLGSVVLFLALFAFLLYLFIKQRKWQQKPTATQNVARNYYLNRPPSITSSLKNGAAPTIVTVNPPNETYLRNGGTQERRKRPENRENGELVVEKVSETKDVKNNEEVHHSPGANSLKRQNRPCKIKLTPDVAVAAQAEAVQTEHTVSDFLEDLKKIRDGNDSVLYEEFQILETKEAARGRNCSVAERERTRNRFIDILPNDDTRVILRGPVDYINASLIDGYKNAGQFIATQGPVGPEEVSDGRKESTVDDFWRMIWEKNVQCVLMLTDCVENMRQRCTQYWPELGESRKFGDVDVELRSESVDPVCTHRELDIKKGVETKEVSQYHFLNWKDAKGPESTGHLLDFIERVMNKQYRKPIVVHCSAGVGRTGVLIALWRLIERARTEHVIDIFGTVDALRKQRSRMVQTPEQYLTLYEALSLAIVEERL